MKIEDFFRDIPNFPKEGILFKDITPLLLNPEATKLCLDTLASTLKDRKINKGKKSSKRKNSSNSYSISIL